MFVSKAAFFSSFFLFFCIRLKSFYIKMSNIWFRTASLVLLSKSCLCGMKG